MSFPDVTPLVEPTDEVICNENTDWIIFKRLSFNGRDWTVPFTVKKTPIGRFK